MSQLIDIPIDQLVLDAGTQARVVLDESLIQQYAELDKDGVELPPIESVFTGDAQHVPWDGFHRIEAFKRNTRRTIKSHTRPGSVEDAKWLCLGANVHHGMRPLNRDRELAVKMALDHPNAKGMTRMELAEFLGMSLRTFDRFKSKMGRTREYKSRFAEFLDEEQKFAITVVEKDFPGYAEVLRNGDLVKDKEELLEYATLPKHERKQLADLFLGRNLPLAKSQDMVNLKPSEETIPMEHFVDFAKNNPGESTWFFRNYTIRVDIESVEES